jgi:hypothetical protein
MGAKIPKKPDNCYIDTTPAKETLFFALKGPKKTLAAGTTRPDRISRPRSLLAQKTAPGSNFSQILQFFGNFFHFSPLCS